MSIRKENGVWYDEFYEMGLRLASFVDTGHSLTVKDIIDSFTEDSEPSAENIMRRAMARARRA